ncbi:MAG: M23 family metallopeptidase [Candidatus Vogelbacteria bacterium]|nr:M23 family metallopeptidase [Candidatus Vogelbacteria bacterium]
MNQETSAKSTNIYALPILAEDLQLSHNYGELPFNSHEGNLKYAVDFLVPELSQVVAALGGTVVYVKQDSDVGGPDGKYWNDGNRIVIRHANREYSAYEHLKCGGSLVVVGQTVECGQLIGYSGNTGYSVGPHLDFEVFVRPVLDESEGETVKPGFVDYSFEVGKVITSKEVGNEKANSG